MTISKVSPEGQTLLDSFNKRSFIGQIFAPAKEVRAFLRYLMGVDI